jgi:hypothetical protein
VAFERIAGHTRRVTTITFIDSRHRPDETQSLLFDPSTSAIIEERDIRPPTHFVATYSPVAVADQVPADVLVQAVPQH